MYHLLSLNKQEKVKLKPDSFPPETLGRSNAPHSCFTTPSKGSPTAAVPHTLKISYLKYPTEIYITKGFSSSYRGDLSNMFRTMGAATDLVLFHEVITKTLLDDAQNGDRNGNLVCLPLSLDIVLGMLTVGAEGDILKQLIGFLRHGIISQYVKLESHYQRMLETFYKTEATRAKLSQAVEEINSWVKKETKGLIESVVKTSDFKMVFWMLKFRASDVKLPAGGSFVIALSLDESHKPVTAATN
nr:hypothetical protein [Tanacetum cinerariifolium]